MSKKSKNLKEKIPKILSVFLVFVFFISFLPGSAKASSITETNIFNLTNNERSKNGLSGLSWNYKLVQAARAKAQDMIDKDYFSHTSPDGRTPWNFITATGYNYIYAGENLGINFTSSEALMSAWMASGGHRANILSGNFKELGVGVVTGEYQGYTTTVVVQMFGAQATSVYGEGSSKNLSSKHGSSSLSPKEASTFDYKAITVSVCEIIKKRLEDYKKAQYYLIKIVKEKI